MKTVSLYACEEDGLDPSPSFTFEIPALPVLPASLHSLIYGAPIRWTGLGDPFTDGGRRNRQEWWERACAAAGCRVVLEAAEGDGIVVCRASGVAP